MHPEIPYLREILVFLVAAGAMVPLIKLLKISSTLGFLLVGLMVGPFGLGQIAELLPILKSVVITDIDGVRSLAELGVIFLLFMIGLELSFNRLWGMRRKVFGLGGAQVSITALVIGLIAFAFGNSIQAAAVLGLCFALSSTAIVMQMLVERKTLGGKVGRASFAVLLMQDLMVVPILFIVGFLGAQVLGNDIGHPALAFAKAIGVAVFAVVIILVIGRLVMRPLMRLVGASKSRELFMAAILLIVIGTAAGAAMAGLSMALGAFLAGILLAETEYKHEIELDIEPFKGLLLGLFFMSVGMTIDLVYVYQNLFWIAVSVVGLFLIKGTIIFALAKLWKYSTGRAFEMACLLGQAGEFVFVVVGAALTVTILSDAVGQFMLIVASISMLASPLVARLGRLGRKFFDKPENTIPVAHQPTSGDSMGQVIIAGYGRIGQFLAEILTRQQISFVAIDMDAAAIDPFWRAGQSVYFGDAERMETLNRLGLSDALALAVTMNNPAKVETIVRQVRALYPNLPIIARAKDTEQAIKLYTLGASHTVPDTVEASLHLGQALLAAVGLPEEAARHAIDLERQAVIHQIEAALNNVSKAAKPLLN